MNSKGSIDEKLSWSLLSPQPISMYVESHDEYITAWHGYLMPQVYALNFTLEAYGKYPTPRMKEHMYQTWKRLYLSGAFGNVNWDGFVEEKPDRVISYLRKMTHEHIVKLVQDMPITETLEWFNNDRLTFV